MDIRRYIAYKWDLGPNDEKVLGEINVGVERITGTNKINVFWILEKNIGLTRSAILRLGSNCGNCRFFNTKELGGQCNCFIQNPNISNYGLFSRYDPEYIPKEKRDSTPRRELNPHISEMVCPNHKPVTPSE